MKHCTKCGVKKNLFDFSKNAKTKDGLQHHCKECKLAYQQANPRRSVSIKKYYEANREECIARTKKSQQKNREYYNGKMREWVLENKERYLQTRRMYYAKNSAAEIARVRRRNGKIKHGEWMMNQAELAEVQGLYDFCKIFKGFEVDHIIPLNGKNVSGLHVLLNLQVLPISENRRKGNRLIEAIA